MRLASSSPTKSSALVAASARVEVEHQHRVGAGGGEHPLALVEAWSGERAAASGLKWRTGCGSKVATITGRRSCAPRATARPTTAWWPRWKPSKLPSATIAPRKRFGDRLVEGQALHRRAALSGDCGSASRSTLDFAPPRIHRWPLIPFTGLRRRIRARVGFSFESGLNALRWDGRVPAIPWS